MDDPAAQLAESLVNAGIYEDDCDPAIGNQERLAGFIREFLARWRLDKIRPCPNYPGHEHVWVAQPGSSQFNCHFCGEAE